MAIEDDIIMMDKKVKRLENQLSYKKAEIKALVEEGDKDRAMVEEMKKEVYRLENKNKAIVKENDDNDKAIVEEMKKRVERLKYKLKAIVEEGDIV